MDWDSVVYLFWLFWPTVVTMFAWSIAIIALAEPKEISGFISEVTRSKSSLPQERSELPAE
jgi:hypothetical protein